jgi:O-methyltransferase
MKPSLASPQRTPEDLYLDLLKKCLTRYEFGEQYELYGLQKGSLKRALFDPIRRLLASLQLALVRKKSFDPQARAEGRDWPLEAETMIGLKRLENLQSCITDLLRRQVPGDLIETGVWRGGASIFMRAVLKVYGDTARTVWVADSFQGLPPPDPDRYPADSGDRLWTFTQLAIPLEQVKANFAKYGLLDDQVRFLVGWFRETLPHVPADRFALLRLDGDLYESTIDALRNLFPKLSVGGYVVVDDYGAIPACKAAVDDFRAQHNITDKIERIDWTGVFWQRSTP